MADIMRPLGFESLVERVVGELKNQKSIFGIQEVEFYKDKKGKEVKVFNQTCSNPLGPAAGPHTQLAQNIITSYLVGARFIELKTVQIMDTLEIEKPCIDARDEGYNVEWSTEYTLPKAFDEYLKAWIILHVIEAATKKQKIEKPSFIFNMSVGYNLEGIKTERMQTFINSMLNAKLSEKFDEYIQIVSNLMDEEVFEGTSWSGSEAKIKKSLGEITTCISPSVTISTMHGCPPKEIEAICNYFLTEKKIDTFVKLNPTLLGYDMVRKILDDLGYDYIGLKRESFEHDLQYTDAIAMLHRLVDTAKANGKGFGVKLTNTLGSVNDQGVLPGEEMYMSGRNLLPISTTVAKKLSDEFKGELPISYSGGANALTVKEIFETGIRPITLATDLLKPGGYKRLTQMVEILENSKEWDMKKIDTDKLTALSDKARNPKEFINKEFRGMDKAKVYDELPLLDCYVAPCTVACPIHQDIPEYIQLMGEGKAAEALAVIYEKNALPHITGWICDHQCQAHCTRLDYEGSVEIREMKKLAAIHGMKEYIEEIWSEQEEAADVAAAVIGAGPAGLSAAYFLRRAGFDVTIFEKEENAGGVVRNIIPKFRIPEEVIQKDIDFILSNDIKIVYGVKDEDVKASVLKENGFDYLFYALGAEKAGNLPLSGNQKSTQAISFLKKTRCGEKISLGKNVVVVGGGNTAMDSARAALRVEGVENVTLVYRRSEKEMPADREEYRLAIKDGVKFMFLTNPENLTDGVLTLREMTLGEKGEDGRRSFVPKETTISIPCSTLLAAIGEKPETLTLDALGLSYNEKGWPMDNEEEGIFFIGDISTGPSTVVRCIASARNAVDKCIDIVLDEMAEEAEDEHDEDCGCGCHDEHEHSDECGCGHDHESEDISDDELREKEDEFFNLIRAKKARITTSLEMDEKDKKRAEREAIRCIECSYLCNKCTEVCPNRANVAIDLRNTGLFEDPYQILHLDAYCNECGNCTTFCPHDGGPYLKKFTLFSRRDDFENSKNNGFLVENDEVTLRLNGEVKTGNITKDGSLKLDTTDEILAIIEEVFVTYSYLLNSVEE